MRFNEKNIEYLKNNYGKSILPLSILDNEYYPGTSPLEILFFWNKESTYSEVKESLFKTIEHYNLFSSRLIMIDDHKFALQYCSDGFKFDFLPPVQAGFDSINVEDINKMVTTFKTLPGEPLFAVTYIPITGGGFVGVRCSHAVGDAFSLILFCFAWKCIIEGNDFPPPSTQRLFKGKPVPSDPPDKIFIPPLSALNNQIKNRVDRGINVRKYTAREYFTDKFFNEIKNDARLENDKYMISNNQIMTAFLLKKYHSQILPRADKIQLRIPINLREVHPDIDAMYIGNAYIDGFTEFTKDEVDKMTISEIAYHLKESINHARSESFIKNLLYLSEYGIEFNPEIFKNFPTYNVETDVVATNLTHLNDPESLGMSSSLVKILHMSATVPTSFIILKEKSGEVFAQVTSRYPLK